MRLTKPPPQIAKHKLFAPPASGGAIRRDALLAHIFNSGSARAVFLQAPAGHGKTTVLQQLRVACEASGTAAAWLTLDEADNDIRRFKLHAQAMLAPLGITDHEGDLGRRRSDWLISRLMQVGAPIALFFDDFQAISDKSLLTFFAELFERLPDNVQVFIATRSMPEMGLARLVVNQRALILQADHLRFSQAEVEQFFVGHDRSDVTADEISAIYRSTEGWPAALQLFRLSLASPSVRQTLVDAADYRPRELAEYLADNVLALQTPPVQDFLLRTSLLERLNASLCHAVTGRSDAQELLLKLERTGLFVRSLDTDLRWFKYHTLFSSFLAVQLQTQLPTVANEVHQAAALWHHERSRWEETVRHALGCRNFKLAADTLDHWASQLVVDAQLVTLERWVDQLPPDEITQRPQLLVKVAWTWVFLHRRSKLKPLMKLLEQQAESGSQSARIVLTMAAISADEVMRSGEWLQGIDLRDHDSEGFGAFAMGAAANVAAYHALSTSQFERTRELLAVARGHNERAGSIFSRGYTVGMQGMNLLVQGQLPAALECFRTGMSEARVHADNSVGLAALVACLIWALYEANELDEAEALFGRHHDIISESALLDFLAVSYLAMVRIHDARGRPGRALQVLDEAESIGHGHGWDRLICLMNWERTRRALVAGQLDRAVAIAALSDATTVVAPGSVFSDDIEGEPLGRIRLAVLTNDFEGAARLLALQRARNSGRVYLHIKLHLLEAQLHVGRGEANAAHRHLHKALQMAGPGGFVRCFLDEGEGVRRLLREDYQRLMALESDEPALQLTRRYVERLLQATGTDLTRSHHALEAPNVENLTDREREIIKLLAAGVGNKAMAPRLFVSENTIKFHLKNIFAKLGVSSRLQATNAARKLGLID